MAKRKGVELTESARRKAEKAGLLRSTGRGAAKQAGEKVIRRQTANQLALDAARRASGLGRSGRDRQGTDSNQ